MFQRSKRSLKKAYFANTRTLLPGKLEDLGKLVRGRISFIQDVNTKYFPRREFRGEYVSLPHSVDNFPQGSDIPYLKFIECPMSEFHLATYLHHLEMSKLEKSDVNNVSVGDNVNNVSVGNDVNNVSVGDNVNNVNDINDINDITDIITDEPDEINEQQIGAPVYSYHSIPTDGYSIYDIVFPNPTNIEYGIFRSSEVRNKILAASAEWRDVNKINIKKFSTLNNLIVGDFLLRANIEKYSTKYAKLLDILTGILAENNADVNKCQKVMIYHDRVKMSGVLLIQELLRANGYIDENSEPTDNTLCCVCGVGMSKHEKTNGRILSETGERTETGEFSKTNGHILSGVKTTHTYYPARFVVAHSDVDKLIMDQSLTKFNTPDNAHGLKYMILIGSKIIKQSYDFKDIQQLIITSLPINIPTLLQVFGRCIRKHSHEHLPPEQRRVIISILKSSIVSNIASIDTISPETYRYIDKLSDYIVIQTIQREFNRNAIDADINRDIIMPPELLKTYFPNLQLNSASSDTQLTNTQPINTINPLYFEPNYIIPNYTLGEVTLSTFNAYKYYESEISMISFIIKYLFRTQPVWTYDDLWARVRKPPIGLEVNPKFFVESNFIIALSNLVAVATPIISQKKRSEMTEAMLVDRLFDQSDRFIYHNGIRGRIEHVDKYYILFPIEDLPSNPLNIIYTEYTEHIRDRERAMIKELAEPNDRVIVDVETYQRGNILKPGMRISIDEYVANARAGINYVAKKGEFVKGMVALKPDGYARKLIDFIVDYSAKFQMTFLEEAIIWAQSSGQLRSQGNETTPLTVQRLPHTVQRATPFTKW